MSTRALSGESHRPTRRTPSRENAELQAMLSTIHEFLDDALSEKQLIGYVDDGTRELLANFQTKFRRAVAAFDDTRRRSHELNRQALAIADGTDLRPITPDDRPELVSSLAVRAVAVEIISKIDLLLSEGSET